MPAAKPTTAVMAKRGRLIPFKPKLKPHGPVKRSFNGEPKASDEGRNSHTAIAAGRANPKKAKPEEKLRGSVLPVRRMSPTMSGVNTATSKRVGLNWLKVSMN